MHISDNVLAVLRDCALTEDSVKLPCKPLPFDTHTELCQVIVSAGGEWSADRQAYVFDVDPRAALGVLTSRRTNR